MTNTLFRTNLIFPINNLYHIVFVATIYVCVCIHEIKQSCVHTHTHTAENAIFHFYYRFPARSFRMCLLNQLLFYFDYVLTLNNETTS